MKKIIITTAILFFAMVLSAQNQPYQPGEKIKYQIKYGMVHGGVCTLQMDERVWNDTKVWHASITGHTTGVADALYKVRDTYETFIDPATDLPLFSIRNISEGRYRKYNEVSFDHFARPDSVILNSDLTGEHIAPKGILDILSCFYWFRKYPLANGEELSVGNSYSMTTWFADELYPIILRYYGTEYIKVKGGKIKCYKFNPVTEVGRLFKTDEDMSIWFTADENFLPIKVRFDIFVGSVNVEMISYEGLTKPLIIK